MFVELSTIWLLHSVVHRITSQAKLEWVVKQLSRDEDLLTLLNNHMFLIMTGNPCLFNFIALLYVLLQIVNFVTNIPRRCSQDYFASEAWVSCETTLMWRRLVVLFIGLFLFNFVKFFIIEIYYFIHLIVTKSVFNIQHSNVTR